MYTAVVIDTLSIQEYIFMSNKLKENIGGSYVIEHLVYKELIPLALSRAAIKSGMDMEQWRSRADGIYLLPSDQSEKVEVGYIGGGNAFLIFRHETDAELFVKTYSALTLQHFPGLKTNYALAPFDYQTGPAYSDFRKELNETLTANRFRFPRQVLPFKPGIVEDCAWSNEAQEVLLSASDTWVSQLSNSRVQYVEASQAQLKLLLPHDKRGAYKFSAELERFGQPDDKGYVAIVHADGNGMGQQFLLSESLSDTRKLSVEVARLADKVMQALMAYILTLIKERKLDALDLSTENGETILPIRPLIAGGDDITFVCEGRIGIHLAEKLLQLMTQTPVNGSNISACAGVSIVHTKYPFYKAYQLAEEAMKVAKKKSRKDNGSWLNYMISTGGFSGEYQDIIAQKYAVHSGDGVKWLKRSPYRVDSQEDGAFSQLKSGMKDLLGENGKEAWPRNKVKDLAEVLRRDEAFQEYFKKELAARDLNLPGKAADLWNGNTTPFFDMIELLDFYPKELLTHEL